MENQTSFDLNQRLQAWRENLSQSPAVRGEGLNELDSKAWMGRSPERRFSRFAKFGLAGVAGIGLLLPNGINMLGNILIMKTVPIGRPELQEVLQAQGYSGMLLIIFNAATLLTLTVILARKRLRRAKAG